MRAGLGRHSPPPQASGHRKLSLWPSGAGNSSTMGQTLSEQASFRAQSRGMAPAPSAAVIGPQLCHTEPPRPAPARPEPRSLARPREGQPALLCPQVPPQAWGRGASPEGQPSRLCLGSFCFLSVHLPLTFPQTFLSLKITRLGLTIPGCLLPSPPPQGLTRSSLNVAGAAGSCI